MGIVKGITAKVEGEEALRRENQALRKEVRDLARLHDAGWRLRQAESLREGLAEILSATVDLLGADMGDVQLLDDKGNFHVAAQIGFEQDFAQLFHGSCNGDKTACASALRSGDPVAVEDIELDPAFTHYRSTARVAGYRAVVSAPLIDRHGALLGIVSTYFRSPHRPSNTDMKRLELYRRRAADFIERFRSDEALRESKERLANILNALPVGVGLFDRVGRFIFRNPVLQRFTNDSIPSQDDPALWQAFDSTGRRLQPDEYPTARALRGEVPPETDKLTTVGGGEERWIRVQAIPVLRNGEVSEGLVVAQDITQSKHAELALRENEGRLRLALASSGMGMWDWDVNTGTYFWNDENYRLFGLKVGEVYPNRATWVAHVHPDDLEAADAAAMIAQREHKDYFNEYRIVRPDGDVRWIRAHGRFIYQDEKPVRMIGLMEDITEARQQIETQRVLVAELQHRTRNLMTVVQSIAYQTLDSVHSLAEFEQRFNSRLEALSRVQSLLSRGDNQPITLGELVVMELEALALASAGDRITFAGPEAPLRKSIVEMLSLANHELLTNAIKYGALANPTGQLSVTWRIEGVPDRRLVLEWIEHGITHAPPSADPGRGGYGRTLIEEALPYSLSAETKFELGADSLRCVISLPLAPKEGDD